MKEGFFRNISLMYFGTFLKFFIAATSTYIYVRVIGSSGYAVLGIIFSFFGIISRFDIPYFLSLIKYNSRFYENKKEQFRTMFNTLYISVLAGNVVIIIVILPIIWFLAFRVYQTRILFLYYIIFLFVYVFQRTNSYLKEFFRANGNEDRVQKSIVPFMTIEFVLTLVFLFIFDLGVISIFLATFISRVIEHLILLKYTGKFVSLRPEFSKSRLILAFKRYGLHNYINISASTLIIHGGLFISTFYLDTRSLGILTIILSIVNKARELILPFKNHLTPLISNNLIKKNHEDTGKMLANITLLLNLALIAALMFLAIAGRFIYTLYFGTGISDSYPFFIWIISGVLSNLSLVGFFIYFFAFDIRYLNRIVITVGLGFFVLIVPLLRYFSLQGIAVLFFATYFIKGMIMISGYRSRTNNQMDKSIIMIVLLSVMAIVLALLNLYFPISRLIIIYMLLMALIFISNIRRWIRRLEYVYNI